MYAVGDAPIAYWYDVGWTMSEIGYWGPNMFAKNSHPGIFNMAFLVGHTEAVRTKDFGPMDTSPFYQRRWNRDNEP